MIEVVAYKPEWPEEFCSIASTLGEVLGVLAEDQREEFLENLALVADACRDAAERSPKRGK